MRKFVLMVVVMAIAAPAMADMVLTGTNNGDGTMTLSYVSDVAPRGVAFKVTATGADIIGSSGQMAEFNANIDYLYTNQSAGIGEGNALALDGGPGVFVSGNVAVISAGVLDTAGGQAAGPLSGDLITIEFSGACTVDVEVDTLRSETGAVGSNIPVDYTAVTGFVVDDGPGPLLTLETAINPIDMDTNGGFNYYQYWLDAGSPDCFAYARQCRGDADGVAQGSAWTGYYHVGSEDLNVLFVAWMVKEPTFGTGLDGLEYNGTPAICADFNHDMQGSAWTGYYRVGSDDLNQLFLTWMVKEPTFGTGVPADCGGTLVP